MTNDQLTQAAKNEQRTKCEIWTRVMGYHRPVSQYNKGKKSEFYSRNYFQEQQLSNSSFVSNYGGGCGGACS